MALPKKIDFGPRTPTPLSHQIMLSFVLCNLCSGSSALQFAIRSVDSIFWALIWNCFNSFLSCSRCNGYGLKAVTLHLWFLMSFPLEWVAYFCREKCDVQQKIDAKYCKWKDHLTSLNKTTNLSKKCGGKYFCNFAACYKLCFALWKKTHWLLNSKSFVFVSF